MLSQSTVFDGEGRQYTCNFLSVHVLWQYIFDCSVQDERAEPFNSRMYVYHSKMVTSKACTAHKKNKEQHNK